MVRQIPTRNATRRASGPSNNSPSDASVRTSGRVTRSRVKNTALNTQDGGSVSSMSTGVTSSRSVSTIPTPTRYGSDNESQTTPLTSDANTPARSASADGLSKLPGFQPASSLLKLQIVLSDKEPPAQSAAVLAPDSMKALSKSKYSLTGYAPNGKRQRMLFMDSSDEEEEEDDEDEIVLMYMKEEEEMERKDAELARKLQEEEDFKVKGETTSSFFDQQASPFPMPHHAYLTRQSLAPKSSLSDMKLPKREIQSLDASDSNQPPITISSDSDNSELEMLPSKKRKTGGGEIVPRASAQSNAQRQARPKRRKTEQQQQPLLPPPPSPPSPPPPLAISDSELSVDSSLLWSDDDEDEESDASVTILNTSTGADMSRLGTRRQYRDYQNKKRAKGDRGRLEDRHPIFKTMWKDLEARPILKAGRADQPKSISRNLKPFQLEGLAWMAAMERADWKGGLLGDEMGLGKTIQAVSLIMSDYPAKKPSLVLVPPVALMQWTSEIASYTDGRLKTFVFHGTNSKTKGMTIKDVKQYDVIIMSYNSLESAYRKQEKGFTRKEGIYKEKSVIHQTHFHRVILDEAHCIKTRSTMTARACFALEVDYRWCLTGTPLQNRIGEFFSLLRFLKVDPFANYVCRDCKCSKLEWNMDESNCCKDCRHRGMRHVSVFNQELLNPIQRYGNLGPGNAAFKKLRLLTDRVMLRRLKKDHTDSMELPVKDIVVDRQFFSEVETDFANSIMTNSQRKFSTYVEGGVMLNNYANIFGLIMQMRQVADHPDLILRKNSEGSQNVLICCICDEPAEEAIRSKCKHDFCRECAKSYLQATDQPDCPRCHIPLSIDLEQPEMEQDELMVKKSSIINRIRMENWTSSSKIELLVHNLYQLRSNKASHKSIIFSQFTTMLQLIEWRLRRAGITTVMLDGSMTPAQRQASIEYFKTHVDVECFLVSLKAGGVALNLTEASRVFIVDPWWNPAAEWQSADRCHRIGQTRPCIVTRLCIEDSVESRMVLLQEKKTRMINSTINSDDAAMESLSPEDLQFLFRGT